MPAPLRARLSTSGPALMLAALLLPLAPAAAFAAAATASQPANLRSGPATSYDVVGKLSAGEAVDVRQCEGTFCEVAYDGKTGWVSAAFLTRGAAAPPQPNAGTSAPQIAAIAPQKPAPAKVNASPAALPPAYARAPAAHLPPANIDADSDASGAAPRPKVDVPGGPLAARTDDGDLAAADAPDDDAFASDDPGEDDNDLAPPRSFRPRGAERPGFRRDFAEIAPAADHACFVDADGGGGFCVHEGERIAPPGRWARHAMLLRNPGRLNVTVCAAPDDCHTYVQSGPVLDAGRPIAFISVGAPGY